MKSVNSLILYMGRLRALGIFDGVCLQTDGWAQRNGRLRPARGRPACAWRSRQTWIAFSQELIGLGQELGEVELVGAGGGRLRGRRRSSRGRRREARRRAGGPRRDSRDGRDRSGTGSGCPARPWCRPPGCTGRRSRRQSVGPAAMQASRNWSISALVSGLKTRAASAFSRTWSVFRIETQHEANRSSVQIACSRP